MKSSVIRVNVDFSVCDDKTTRLRYTRKKKLSNTRHAKNIMISDRECCKKKKSIFYDKQYQAGNIDNNVKFYAADKRASPCTDESTLTPRRLVDVDGYVERNRYNIKLVFIPATTAAANPVRVYGACVRACVRVPTLVILLLLLYRCIPPRGWQPMGEQQ